MTEQPQYKRGDKLTCTWSPNETRQVIFDRYSDVVGLAFICWGDNISVTDGKIENYDDVERVPLSFLSPPQ